MTKVFTPYLQREFSRLSNELSPENLSRDGEASRAYVAKRLRELKAQWRQLEQMAGRKVTELEVEDWLLEQWRKKE